MQTPPELEEEKEKGNSNWKRIMLLCCAILLMSMKDQTHVLMTVISRVACYSSIVVLFVGFGHGRLYILYLDFFTIMFRKTISNNDNFSPHCFVLNAA